MYFILHCCPIILLHNATSLPAAPLLSTVSYTIKQGCHSPGNSWIFEVLLETPRFLNNISVSPGNLLEIYFHCEDLVKKKREELNTLSTEEKQLKEKTLL